MTIAGHIYNNKALPAGTSPIESGVLAYHRSMHSLCAMLEYDE